MTKSNITYGLGVLFFLLMLVIPTTFQLERGILLIIIISIIFINILLTKNWRIHKEVAVTATLCLVMSIVFV